MKRILLSCIAFTIFTTSAYAQCTIDPNAGPGVFTAPPGTRVFLTWDAVNQDSITNFRLPYAQVNQPYSQVLQFRVPKDTTVPGFGQLEINNIKVIALEGAPSGFTIAPNPTDSIFPSQTRGCLTMSGISTVADSIELRLAVQYDIKSPAAPSILLQDTLKDFYLVTQNLVSIDENPKFTKPKLFPNPANASTSLTFTSVSNDVHLKVYNIIGDIIYQEEIKATNGANEIKFDTSKWTSGVYVYSLKSSGQTFSGRFVVNH
jgi:hypothetical protein